MKKFLSILKKHSSRQDKKLVGFVRYIDGKNKYVMLELFESEFVKVYFHNMIDIDLNIVFNIVTVWYDDENSYFFLKKVEILVKFSVLFPSFKKKKTELHIISNFSKLDGVVKLRELFLFLSKINVKRVAITDDSDINSYFECLKLSKKYNIEVLFSTEVWYFDDLKSLNIEYDKEFIVVDIETNGIYSGTNEILEIGAYRFKNKQLLEKFETLIKIKDNIKPFITQLTGITEKMIVNQPSEKKALLDFKKFMYKNIDENTSVNLVSHSNFDPDFLSARYKKFNLHIPKFVSYDTLMLSRMVWPGLNKYNLKFLSHYFNIDLNSHHRALDDAKATTYLFSKILLELRNKKKNVIYLNSKLNYLFRIILIAKNLQGVRDILKILSVSHTDDYYKIARVRKSLLNKYRDNILLIDPFYNGTLSSAFIKKKNNLEILELSKWFDAVEILSLESCKHTLNFMTRSDRDYQYYKEQNQNNKKLNNDFSIDEIADWLKQLYDNIGNKLFISSGARYLFPNDVIAWNILKNSAKKKGSFFDPMWFFHTQEDFIDLLKIFNSEQLDKLFFHNLDFLLKDAEYNIDLFSNINITNTKEKHQEFKILVYKKAKEYYGDNLHPLIVKRIDKELKLLCDNHFVNHYAVVYELVKYIHKSKQLLGSRGSIGSSFIGFLLNITEVNPLPAHYFCKRCSLFIDMSKEYFNGFDLPEKTCYKCNDVMKENGNDLSIEIFLGKEGKKMPDIDLNVSTDFQNNVHQYIFNNLKSRQYCVLRSGTILLVKHKNAILFIDKYLDSRPRDIINQNKDWISAQVYKLVDSLNAYGRHPGGLLVDEHNILLNYTFSSINSHQKNDPVWISKIQYKWLKKFFFKIDILGHDDPKTLKFLLDYTGASLDDVKFNDTKILRLFNLGYTAGIPEFCTGFSKRVLKDIKPTKFSELVDISGLTHGINVWFHNNQKLIKKYKISELVCSRDDILYILINKYKCDFDFSYRVMEFVRHGKIKQDFQEWKNICIILKKYKVDDWFINSMSKITYIFPKAHACAYVISAFRIAFFKVYYPNAFYLSILNKYVSVFDLSFLKMNKQTLLEYFKQRNKYKIKPADRPLMNLLRILLELRFRKDLNFSVSRPHLQYSDSSYFILKNKKLFPPLCCIKGIGLIIAKNIIEQRKIKDFSNVFEFQKRCKLGPVLSELILKNIDHYFDTEKILQGKFFDDIDKVV